jgi:hypothetical protein
MDLFPMPVGWTFIDSNGAKRIKNRWGFNSFVFIEGARGEALGHSKRSIDWYIWRLADGSYDYSITANPNLPGHPAELVEVVR